jgi:hypothetical protein
MASCSNCGASLRADSPRDACWRCGQRPRRGAGAQVWAPVIGGALLLAGVAAVVVMRQDALDTSPEVSDLDPTAPTEEEPEVPDPEPRRILMDTPSGDTLDVAASHLAVADPPSPVAAPEEPEKTAKPPRPPRPASKPSRVRFGSMTVSGRLQPAVVRDALEQRRSMFQTCVPSSAAAHATATVRFVIGRNGAVSNVTNGGADGLGSAAVNCLVRPFYGMTFPKPEGGIVTVAVRLTFDPA